VDASPEHLRPRFDGGTGVRTVRATQAYQLGCIPDIGLEQLDAVRNGVQSENHESNEGTG
jgi:hypothetical protein